MVNSLKQAKLEVLRKELIALMRERNIIHTGPVTLSSGLESNRYFEVKRLYAYPEALELAAEGVWLMMDEKTTCVAGSEVGGLPLATAISLKHGPKLVAVRDKAKDHGVRDGGLPCYVPGKDDLLSFVDDVYSTGTSLKRMMAIMSESADTNIAGLFVVLTRDEEKSGSEKVKHLVTAKEVLAHAREKD